MPTIIGDCTTEQRRRVSLAYTTAIGNPATTDGPTIWSVEQGDATVDTVGKPTDPPLGQHEAYLVSGALSGTSIIRHSADADLGAGIRNIEDTIEFVVSGAEAAFVSVSAQPAEPK